MPPSNVPTDVYIRLRGTECDSPVIIFRDFDSLLEKDKRLNLIFSLVDQIGPVVQVKRSKHIKLLRFPIFKSTMVKFRSFSTADLSFDLPDYDDEQIVGHVYDVKLRNALDFVDSDVGRYVKSTSSMDIV